MLIPVVTPAIRRQFYAWLFFSCAFTVFSQAQPAPIITGESVVCPGVTHFYATEYHPGHSWAWSVSPGGVISQNFGNYISVHWTGPQNTNQWVYVAETDGAGLSGNDQHPVAIKSTVLACENSVNVSLDQTGVGIITPTILLDGNYVTYEGFNVTVTTFGGNYLGNSVSCSNIGQTLIGQVTDICTGNSCWSTIHVEDKKAPLFSCPTTPTNISCDTDVENFPAPLVVDNCDATPTVSMVGYQVDNSNICNGVTVTRNWFASDDYGNESYCSEQLFIKPDGDIFFPKDTTWTCQQYNLHPNITDATPLEIGIDSTGSGIPTGASGTYCQYSFLHSDDTLQTCGNAFKIIRTWTVINWCTGQILLTDANGLDNEQVIVVMDNTPPTMTIPVPYLNANLKNAYGSFCATTGLLPAPSLFDDCNSVTVQIFTSVGEAEYVNGINGNAGGNVPWPGLQIGNHTVTYKATDACGNVTEIPVLVHVVDTEVPIVICDEITDVTLNQFGFAEVFATSFDDGSHDNCCVGDMVVKRMGQPDWAFAPSVDFSCDDVQVTVVMRVYDCWGNHNECMVQVNVNDKQNPVCIAPPTKVIPCTDLPADITPSWVASFGNADIADNCTGVVNELPYIENINNCGEGHVIRYFVATDLAGNSSTCEQHIYVTPASDWLIKFPADWYGACGDSLAAPLLEVNNFGCDMFAVSYEDQFFTLALGDSACYKIVRTWKVINWCSYTNSLAPIKVPNNPFGVWVDEEDFNNYGYYEYQQIIKVYDDTPPVLSYPFANEFCSVDENCGDGPVFLPIQIDGECSGQFNVVYHLDLFSNLSYDLSGTGFFDGTLPVGNHRILYLVEDGCSNDAQLIVDFVVKDCKKPTPICENGLIVELMQTGMIEICAESFDYGSYDNCPGPLTFSLSSDVTETCRIYNCTSAGETENIQMWVTDAAGNQSYCETFVHIQDNMFSCANGQPIVGFIATEDDEALQGANVQLNGTQSAAMFTTAEDGMYEFDDLEIGNDYSVTPQLDASPLNGVTTFDLVLITRHILGTQDLGSPYKLIAADANNSGSITTFDLVELRKLILYVNTEFINNESWRFVDKSYVFPNPANPWTETFPEVININNLGASVSGADFVAIKIGDVNGNASTNLQGTGDERGTGMLLFDVEDQAFEAGQTVTVLFKAKDFTDVHGYQFTIDFDAQALEFQTVVPTSYTAAENFGTTMTEYGALMASWYESLAPVSLPNGETLMALEFKAKSSGQLKDAVGISSRFTNAEAYIGTELEIWDVELEVLQGSLSAAHETSANGYTLFQNSPNPFNGKTTIGFELPVASEATLTVMDVTGKTLKTVSGNYAAGHHKLTLDSKELPAEGILIYRLETPAFTASRTMSLVK